MRRRVIAILAGVAVGLGTAVACSFPDVTFDDTPASGDATAEGGLDASDDAPILLDGSDPDALIVHDGGGPPIDASGCTVCDCDHDGFNNTGKPGCEGGLNDCDDSDPRANPNQGYLVDEPGPPMEGNWNCTNGVEYLYPENFDCTSIAVSDCATAAGFTGIVGCGNFGTLTHCKVTGISVIKSCGAGSMVAHTQQACK